MQITLDNKIYDFHIGYQKEDLLRHAFNHLVEKNFHFTFESWYQEGYWNDKYIPYTLFDKQTAIANVSINIMHFEVFAQAKCYIQIGTVMTDDSYRWLGLSRFLMEFVLKQWKGKCDLIYLYANNSVLNMYPKFGFKPISEYTFFKPVFKTDKRLIHQKLDMDNSIHREMLYYYAKNTKASGKLSMQDSADLIMFYCTSFLKDSVFYIQALDTIVIATFNNNQALLWDVFSPVELVALDAVITLFNDLNVELVQFGFTPLDISSYS